MSSLQQVQLVAWIFLPLLGFLLGLVVKHGRRARDAPRVGSSGASSTRADVVKVNASFYRPYHQRGTPSMQVLFFHGMPSQEDYSQIHLTTWCHSDGFLWPPTWLPKIKEDIHVHVYFVNYIAALDNEVAKMHNIGGNLVSDLLQTSIGQVSGCPVVLVGHCIGGLVIKELCWQAYNRCQSKKTEANQLRHFLKSVEGIFFYSTPHEGIKDLPTALARASKEKGTFLKFCKTPLFKYCEILSSDTNALNIKFETVRENYCESNRKWRIEAVGEGRCVKSGVFKGILVVSEASASVGVDIYYPLYAEDHFSVCKPGLTTSGGFNRLTVLLHNILQAKIQVQCQAQKKLQRQSLEILPKSIVGIENILKEIILAVVRLEKVVDLASTRMEQLGNISFAKAPFEEDQSYTPSYTFEYSCRIPNVKLISGDKLILELEVWKYMSTNREQDIGEEDCFQLKGKEICLVLDDISEDFEKLLDKDRVKFMQHGILKKKLISTSSLMMICITLKGSKIWMVMAPMQF